MQRLRGRTLLWTIELGKIYALLLASTLCERWTYYDAFKTLATRSIAITLGLIPSLRSTQRE